MPTPTLAELLTYTHLQSLVRCGDREKARLAKTLLMAAAAQGKPPEELVASWDNDENNHWTNTVAIALTPTE